MRFNYMAPLWKKVVAGMALFFIFWSIWLVFTTQSLQQEAADMTRLGNKLLSLDSWLRTWDDRLLDSPAVIDSLYKKWTPLRDRLQDKQNVFTQAGSEKTLYQRTIARTDSSILKLFFQSRAPKAEPGKNTSMDYVVVSHAEIYILLVEIRVLGKLLRHQLNLVLIQISHKWKQLNMLVLISTCLVLFAAVLLFFYSRNINRLENLRETLSYKTSVLECLTNAADDGILVIINEQEIFAYNQKLLKLWHLSEREMQYSNAHTMLDILASKLTKPEHFKAEIAHLNQHKFEKSQGVLDLIENATFEIFSAPIISERGIYYGRVWYFRDITSHTKAKYALQRSEQHFRSLVRNASDIISIHDMKGRIRFENPAVSKILGYPSGALTGKNIFKFIHEADVRRIQRQLSLMINHPGFERTLNLRFRHKDGSWRILEAIGKAIKKHDGVTTFLVTSRDKTQRMRIQKLQNMQFAVTKIISTARSMDTAIPGLLKEIGEKLQGAYGEMWLLTDSETQLKYKYNWQSGSSSQRISRDQLILDKNKFCELILGPTCLKKEAIRFSAISQCQAWQACISFEREIYAEALAFPILNGRQVIGIIFLLFKNEIDITAPLPQLMLDIGSQTGQFLERLDAEKALSNERALLSQRVKERTAELLIANKELAFAAKSKDEFLANMSHEFRTPLNIIIGLCEALNEKLFGELSDEQKEAICNIDDSGKHLLTLINDILDLSRIEAGNFQLDIAPTSIESVTEASIRMVSEMAIHKRISIEKKFNPAIEIVEADARRLKQILVNLLSNAIKFTPKGRSIGVEISGGKEDSAVQFSIWDKGVGIPARDMQRLFNPFVQLDAGLSRSYSGTGMGLVLVKRLVELHGGGVSLRSKTREGSVFTISLPWRNPASIHALDDDNNGSQRNGLSEMPKVMNLENNPLALIVESNKISIKLHQHYLNNFGFRSEVIRNPHELMSVACQKHPALILVEISDAELNAFDFIRKLRTVDDLKETALFVVSTLRLPGDQQQCLDAGADGFFSNPICENEFHAALTKMFLAPYSV
ncbi:MAG: PAS domain S-box protein [Calditrichaeota bacterium]|nr:MAG: PAS domain S-box protein [Calditrichota bacterium]